jgi:hypothetical protein
MARKFAAPAARAYDTGMQMERRRMERDRRVSWRIPVVCAVRNTVAGRLYLGQAEDIGPGGITLRRPRDLPVLPQTPITMSFDLPGAPMTFDVDGLVVSDRRTGSFRRTGIRFVGPSAELLALLGEYRRRV